MIKISHLTYRSITDHLAIVRNDVDSLADDIIKSGCMDKAAAKIARPLLRKAMHQLLGHAQTLAEIRREGSENVE